MDFKKILGDTKSKVDNFLKKDSTKKAIGHINSAADKIKSEFDEVCDKADVKIKGIIESKKNKSVSEDITREDNSVDVDNKDMVKSEVITKDILSDDNLLSVGLSAKVVKSLIGGGIMTVTDLKSKDISEIKLIKGVGAATLEKIIKIKG
jgi:hypothetical protein